RKISGFVRGPRAGAKMLPRSLDVLLQNVTDSDATPLVSMGPELGCEQKKEKSNGAIPHVNGGLAVPCCVKVKVPGLFSEELDSLFGRCALALQRMLAHREWSSSKHYGDRVPCVVSKSLIAKYQQNPKCCRARNVVI